MNRGRATGGHCHARVDAAYEDAFREPTLSMAKLRSPLLANQKSDPTPRVNFRSVVRVHAA